MKKKTTKTGISIIVISAAEYKRNDISCIACWFPVQVQGFGSLVTRKRLRHIFLQKVQIVFQSVRITSNYLRLSLEALARASKAFEMPQMTLGSPQGVFILTSY